MIKWARPLILSALVYYLLGLCGQALAIAPGFSAAVWPAAGGALFCLIYFRQTSVLVGIFLSAFVLTLAINSDNFNRLSDVTFILAFCIALGATLQAQIGFFLYRRLVGFRSVADTPSEVLKFILIVTPVSCLVCATFGVSILSYFDIISVQNYLFSWLTWWSGDSIGVLFFTPLLLTVFSRDKRTSLKRRSQMVLPVLAIFMGIVLLYFSSIHSRELDIQKDLEDNGKRFSHEIEERLEKANQLLAAYLAFFQSSNTVERSEFSQFSEIIFSHTDVFHAVGWTEIVGANDRNRIELAVQQQGFSDFQFTELTSSGQLVSAAPRERYFPVLYIYPYAENKAALGLNLGANLTRKATLEQAMQLRHPVSTPPIRLAQERQGQLAYIVYVPVFGISLEDRMRDQLASDTDIEGFLSGVLRMDNILDASPAQLSDYNFGFELNDVTDKHAPILLAVSGSLTQSPFQPVKYQLDFAGRKLEFVVFVTRQYSLSSKDWTSWAILAGGLLLVALLQGFILLVIGNTAVISREVKRKTRALSRATAVADKANQAKSNFTATISHEIRTPLNAIIGLVNQCLKTKLTQQQLHYMQQTKLASGTLLSLINLTLDLSKIESGKLEIENIEFDLGEIIEKINAIFNAQARQKGIDFKLELPQRLPNLMIGDPLRIEQILLNLCGNGIKFTPQGQVALRVAIEAIEGDKVKLELSVSDTGIGIAADKQTQLFESFQQADSSMSRKFGGSGLGLAISKQLAELMGGNIGLHSIENEGTTFNVCLFLSLAPANQFVDSSALNLAFNNNVYANDPLAEPNSVAADQDVTDNQQLAQDMTTEVDKTEQPLANISVLLVEDVKINQFIATEILQEYGATVSVAENGLEAIQFIEKQDFDVVLMDIQMPEMDGYEATRILRLDPRFERLYIIAMTANAMQSDIDQALAAGMNAHIAKPIDETEMLQKILVGLSDSALK